MLAASAVALAAGCGGGADPAQRRGPPATIPVDPPQAPPPATPDPAVPCGGAVTVRLKGSGVPAGRTVRLQVSRVALLQVADVLQPSFVGIGEAVFPVAGTYRMAVVPAPPPGREVVVQLHLAGGQVCEGDRCTPLQPCGAPLITVFDPAKVRADNCHVVIDLDLARSIQPVHGGLATLLQYRLGY